MHNIPEAPDKGIPYDHVVGPTRTQTKQPKSPHQIFLEQLGENIKMRREAKGLSLDAGAKKIGISAVTLDRIEKGKVGPSFNTLCRIAEGLHFNITIAYQGKDIANYKRK